MVTVAECEMHMHIDENIAIILKKFRVLKSLNENNGFQNFGWNWHPYECGYFGKNLNLGNVGFADVYYVLR